MTERRDVPCPICREVFSLPLDIFPVAWVRHYGRTFLYAEVSMGGVEHECTTAREAGQ